LTHGDGGATLPAMRAVTLPVMLVALLCAAGCADDPGSAANAPVPSTLPDRWAKVPEVNHGTMQCRTEHKFAFRAPGKHRIYLAKLVMGTATEASLCVELKQPAARANPCKHLENGQFPSVWEVDVPPETHLEVWIVDPVDGALPKSNGCSVSNHARSIVRFTQLPFEAVFTVRRVP
jgi:hypothetical protein